MYHIKFRIILDSSLKTRINTNNARNLVGTVPPFKNMKRNHGVCLHQPIALKEKTIHQGNALLLLHGFCRAYMLVNCFLSSG